MKKNRKKDPSYLLEEKEREIQQLKRKVTQLQRELQTHNIMSNDTFMKEYFKLRQFEKEEI